MTYETFVVKPWLEISKGNPTMRICCSCLCSRGPERGMLGRRFSNLHDLYRKNQPTLQANPLKSAGRPGQVRCGVGWWCQGETLNWYQHQPRPRGYSNIDSRWRCVLLWPRLCSSSNTLRQWDPPQGYPYSRERPGWSIRIDTTMLTSLHMVCRLWRTVEALNAELADSQRSPRRQGMAQFCCEEA